MENVNNDEIKLSLEQTLDKWAQYAIEKFQRAMDKKKIIGSDRLYNSFAYELKKLNGDVDKVIMKFNHYGRFLDMGVGRGVRIDQVKDNRSINSKLDGSKTSTRRPKKWYSPTLFHQTLRLREVLAKEFGIQTVSEIEKKFKDNDTTFTV